MKRLLLILFTIHYSLSTVHAQAFDNLPTPGEEKVIDNTPDSIAKALMNRPAPGSTRQGDNPVLFLIGNSTMRNGTLGKSISTDVRSPLRTRPWEACPHVPFIQTCGLPFARR